MHQSLERFAYCAKRLLLQLGLQWCAVVAVASVALFALGRSLSLSIGRSCAAGGAQRKAHSGGGTTRRNASKSKSKSIVRQ